MEAELGEAKRKIEELKSLVIKQFERWDFPSTDAEVEAVREIRQLPVVMVQRYPADKLAWMRMPTNQCHANARFMVDNDPEGKIRQVTGFWPQAGNFVLHSVIEREGVLNCVTPLPFEAPAVFPFIPDPEIEWVEEGDYRTAYRKGLLVEPGLRSDPAENARIAAVVMARINSGIHPLKAGEPPFD